MNRFPKDCWGKNCPHFRTVDMSIDDLLCACDILQAKCDACDEDFCFLLCPLSEHPLTDQSWDELEKRLRGGRRREKENFM